nr:MAG TPA: baseplate protein [Caudoviricetes sp.]
MAFSGTFDSNGYPIDADTNTGDTGWHICDGTNGTPDLRGRFILGVSDSHAVGSTGGEEKHTLTIDELPKVSGSVQNYLIWGDGRAESGVLHNLVSSTRFPSASTENAYASKISISFGNDQPHNNMPPYYTLSYIMKL